MYGDGVDNSLEMRQRRAAVVTAVLFLIAVAFGLGWSFGQAALIR